MNTPTVTVRDNAGETTTCSGSWLLSSTDCSCGCGVVVTGVILRTKLLLRSPISNSSNALRTSPTHNVLTTTATH